MKFVDALQPPAGCGLGPARSACLNAPWHRILMRYGCGHRQMRKPRCGLFFTVNSVTDSRGARGWVYA
ncbi:MAG TPA: hypothetical protein VHI98_14075 [Vicinamibacterales bacterium]|nr:hypothetical protein [Vicinamibacterales bacterium]